MAILPPLLAAPNVDSSNTSGLTKADFDELKGRVLGLAASVKTFGGSTCRNLDLSLSSQSPIMYSLLKLLRKIAISDDRG
jgi:hypothetical protein